MSKTKLLLDVVEDMRRLADSLHAVVATMTGNTPSEDSTPDSIPDSVLQKHTGAHDMYKSGEYMVYTDREVYKCLQDTAYSPTDYAQAWQAV